MLTKLVQFTVSEVVINGHRIPLQVSFSVPVPVPEEPQSYPIPPRKYAQLVEHVVSHGGLPGSSFPESARILSEEVGWDVDPDALRLAWYRYKKRKKVESAEK